MSNRPVATAESEFATACLPPADEEESVVVAEAADTQEPHEVLGVAPDDVVEAVARRLMAKHHADSDAPNRDEFVRVWNARDAMLSAA